MSCTAQTAESNSSTRLLGDIVQPPHRRVFTPTPSLQHLTLYGVTGTFLDRHALDECFPEAQLESFTYALVHRLGFELRNHHLESLANPAHGHGLRRLVLLGCSRLSSTTITRCLESLPMLEYFALHLATVDELRSNFVLALPTRLSVFKLQVINVWYAIALVSEERLLCDAIERVVLLRETPLCQVCLCFRTQLMAEGGRQERWTHIARERRFELEVGPWESQMLEEI
ncbi:hypothetical protein BD414DRAFT_95892 [Trametes punicea]|nr:hypothetical protein BD414DRAFT_95892 [Trametes punicea]